jgi:hypothetical protein
MNYTRQHWSVCLDKPLVAPVPDPATHALAMGAILIRIRNGACFFKPSYPFIVRSL